MNNNLMTPQNSNQKIKFKMFKVQQPRATHFVQKWAKGLFFSNKKFITIIFRRQLFIKSLMEFVQQNYFQK